jgi:uncharacterized membrane protein
MVLKKKVLWILLVTLAIVIGLYPTIYFILDKEFGLLGFKSGGLLTDPFWNSAFYMHIFLGGLALLIGWAQFGSNFRTKNRDLHWQIGKVYILSVLSSAVAGIYISFSATGGLLAALGFICLGLVWLVTTLMAFINIKKSRIDVYQKLMAYSYAACFAAVTSRIWLILLVPIFGNFTIVYIIVAWFCWVPNLVVAKLIIKWTMASKNHANERVMRQLQPIE